MTAALNLSSSIKLGINLTHSLEVCASGAQPVLLDY